jgi:hypothetical protein
VSAGAAQGAERQPPVILRVTLYDDMSEEVEAHPSLTAREAAGLLAIALDKALRAAMPHSGAAVS